MAKTYDQYMSESGQQTTLDQQRASGQYETAKANWENSSLNQTATAATPTATPTSSYSPTKTFDQYLAESGRQSLLDQIRATPGQYEQEVAKYNAGQSQYATTPQAGPQAGTTATTGLLTTQPTIDLPGIYKSLTESSGVSGLEEQYSNLEKQYIEARNKISDNPFLEASIVDKRLARLKGKFEEEIAPIQNKIATRKADVETQLNLQTKQFDINSQLAQTALSQFTALLDAGALDSASGTDIANITRSTGLSSSVIQSAIENKKTANLSTTIQSFDDGIDEGFIIYTIDPQGNMVNQSKQVTGKSSKADSTLQYSADPGVSAFLSSFMSGNTSTQDISSLWL